MQKLILTLALGAALLPQASLAEVTGAQVGFDYSTLAEDGMGDINKAALSGSLEYALSPQFSVQGDIAQRYFGLTSTQGSNFTLHGAYHPTSAMSVGAFVGRDWVDHEDVDHYGVEFANRIDRISYQAALTHYDGSGSDANALSLAGGYALSSMMDVGGRFDILHANGEDSYRIGGTVGYEISPGLTATGEIGFYDPQDWHAETYVGIGLKATFGANGGTTFAGRSLMDLVPGM